MSGDPLGMDDADQFRLEDGILHCPEDLNRFAPKDVRAWCRKLLESPAEKLTVDLTRTRYMASHHLGILSEAWSKTLESGRELVVMISSELRRLFELSGFDQVFTVVDGEEDRP